MSSTSAAWEYLYGEFRRLLGPPRKTTKKARCWSSPSFAVALKPRGKKQITVWLEASARPVVEARPGLPIEDYPPDRPRNSSLGGCPRLCEGNAVIRVPCPPDRIADIVLSVRELLDGAEA